MIKTLFAFLILLNIQSAFSQKTIVKFNLSARKAESVIPFDEPFLVQGNASDQVVRVEFKYKIKDEHNKTWHYLPSNTNAFSPVSIWTREDDSDAFIVDCGALHPNVTYEFHFKIRKKISIDNDKKKEVNEKILKQLKLFFTQDNITLEKIQDLRTQLNTLIGGAINTPGTFVDVNGNAISRGPFEPPLKEIADRVNHLTSQIAADKTSASASAAANTLVTNTAVQKAIADILYDISTEKIKLHPVAQSILDMPLDPSIDGFATYEGKDVLAFAVLATGNPNYLKQIIEGNAKIGGKNLDTSGERHLPSLRLLAAFFRLINNPRFMNAAGQPIFDAQRGDLDTILSELELLIKREVAIENNKKESDKLIESFPDLFVNTFLQNDFVVVDHPFIDVTSEKSPYVGLDVGLVGAPWITSIFSYQGLNLYLAPVNKNTPLDNYKNRDKFRKRFSIYLGIAQNITKGNYDRYENLIEDTGGVLVGCGWRVSRVFRANVGGLLFKQRDENPIVDKSRLAVTPTVSLSLDINISKAFGDVISKALKF